MSDTSFTDDDFDIDDVFTDSDPTQPAAQSAAPAETSNQTSGRPSGKRARTSKAAGAPAANAEKKEKQRVARVARAAKAEVERQVGIAVRVARLNEPDLAKLAGVIGAKAVTAETVAVSLITGAASSTAISDILDLARMDHLSAGAHTASADRGAQKAMWSVLTAIGAAAGDLKPNNIEAALQVASSVVGLTDDQIAELEAFHEMIGG